MEEYLKKYGMHSILISIALIIFALLLIFKPIVTLSVLMIGFGCIIAINGLVHTISYFQSPVEFRPFSFELVYGILGIIAGFVIVLNPEFVIGILPFIIGLWILVESIIHFQLSINMRNIPNSNWVLMLILSILTTAFGIYIMFHPAVSATILTALCGAFLLISEIISVFESIYLMIRLK